MVTALCDTNHQPVTTLHQVNRILEAGGTLLLMDGDTLEVTVRFPATPGSRLKHVFVKGMYPHDVEHLLRTIADPVERTRVQWFDGCRFHNWF
jgi:hypothetical protein